MDILNCFRYVEQPYNFIQPLVDLELVGLGGLSSVQTKRRCWAGISWDVQLWSSVLGTARVGTGLGTVLGSRGSQNGAGMVPFLPSALPCCHGSPWPGEGSCGKCSTACGALGCNPCSGLFPSAWPCVVV